MMNKLYSKPGQALVIILLIALGYIILHPRLNSVIFSNIRQQRWNSFKNMVIQDKTIDGQDYWQLREFYGVGNFELNKTGLPQQEVLQFLQTAGFTFKKMSLIILFSSINLLTGTVWSS